MNVIAPARGEFGLKLRYHVPVVHALPGPKVVYCEEGEEALFPSADMIRHVPSPEDDNRRGMMARDVEPVVMDIPDGATLIRTRPGMAEAWFQPEPAIYQGVNAEVVVCPRFRMYGASKNWDAWPEFTEMLACGEDLYTFAAGTEDTSYGVVAHEHAWGYSRPLDATIEAMNVCKLVVATSSGLAILAMLCGAPLLLISYRGMIAPGPVVDALGRVLEPSYGPVPVDRLIEPCNHMNAPITVIDAWEQPDDAIDAVLELVEC